MTSPLVVEGHQDSAELDVAIELLVRVVGELEQIAKPGTLSVHAT